jgi:hypothetical protein
MRRLLFVLSLAVSPSIASADRLAADPSPVPQASPAVGVEPQPAPDPHEPMRRFDPDAPPTGDTRFMLSDLTIFRLNPLGLETRARIGFQKRMYYSEKAIGKNNFWFAGVYPKLNPASAHIAVGGELQPASILNVKVFGEFQKYFGTFGYLQSFTSVSPDTNYSDAQLKDMRDDPATEPQQATIMHLGVAPLLQIKIAKGKIALRALTQLDYWDASSIRSGETSFYEPTFDTLLPDKGWTLAMDNDLLYTGAPNLAVGLRHTWVHPFYKREHFATQAEFDAYDNENSHHRLGLFLAKTFRDDGPSRFNKPTLVLILSWYLTHKYRAGEPGTLPMGHTADDYVSRAMPYVILGFAFESDFMSVSKTMM